MSVIVQLVGEASPVKGHLHLRDHRAEHARIRRKELADAGCAIPYNNHANAATDFYRSGYSHGWK